MSPTMLYFEVLFGHLLSEISQAIVVISCQ